MEAQRQQSLLLPSSPTIGYNGGNDLILSLSLSLYIVTLSLTADCYTTSTTNNNDAHTNCFCPKSYLYTYGPKGLTRTHSHMCPFQPVGKITTGS